MKKWRIVEKFESLSKEGQCIRWELWYPSRYPNRKEAHTIMKILDAREWSNLRGTMRVVQGD